MVQVVGGVVAQEVDGVVITNHQQPQKRLSLIHI